MAKSLKFIGQFTLIFVLFLMLSIIGGAFEELTWWQVTFLVFSSVSAVIVSSAGKMTHKLGDDYTERYIDGSNIVKQSGWKFDFDAGDSSERLCDFSVNGIRAIKAMRPLELQQELPDVKKRPICSPGFKSAQEEIDFLRERCRLYEHAMKVEVAKSLDDFEKYFTQYLEAYMERAFSEVKAVCYGKSNTD